MDTITALVDTQLNVFLEQGEADGVRFVRIAVPRNPDVFREKYSGNPADPFVPKTEQEIAAALESIKDAAAAAQYDTAKMLKAKGISDLAFRLGKAPGALTPAELSAERTRIINIYKAL